MIKSVKYSVTWLLFLITGWAFASTKRTVDADGGSSYTTLTAAIQASSDYDTIYIQGSDVDTYNESFPAGITFGNLTFMGAATNPDNFPVITLTNWSTWWTSYTGTTRFECVVLKSCATINLTTEFRKCTFEKVIVKDFTSDVFTLRGTQNIYLNIYNTIFWNNNTIFGDFAEVSGFFYAYVRNSTFYDNSVVNAHIVDADDITNQRVVRFINSIFNNNTTICSDTKNSTLYNNCLIPSAENLANWGTGIVQNDNPQFVNATPVNASDFAITSTSTAINAGSDLTDMDIAGRSRTSPYDLGAYEYIAPYIWDTSTTAGYQAGNGTWGTHSYWSTNGTTLVAWPGAGNYAKFAGTDGTRTITVNGTQSADGLLFDNSGYLLNSGTINLGTNSAISVASGKTDTIASVIDGSGGLALSGGGTLILRGTNTYIGQTTISSGCIFNIRSAAALGATSSGTTVNSGAALQLQGGLTFNAEPLTLNGTGVSSNGALCNVSGINVWTGTVALSSASTIAVNGNELTISGVIGGTGDLTKSGGYRLFLAGNNTYTGTTTISGTNDILLRHINALGATSSGTTVNTGAAIGLEGYSNEIANASIYGAEPLTLNGSGPSSGGVLQFGSGTNTSATWSGNISIASASIISCPETGDSLIISGIISGTADLTKIGSGKIILTGANTHTGTLTVSTGELIVNGSTASGSAVTVNSGTTLSGTGTIAGSVAMNGIITPGGTNAGKLSTGALTLASGSTLNFNLGTTSDTIAITGNLVLDGTLNITEGAGYTRSTYTIMTYTGTVTNNNLKVVSPDGSEFGVIISGGFVKIVPSGTRSFKPITVATTASQCSVYTDNWTLVFDNTLGGGIKALTDSIHGLSRGQGNQAHASYPLYWVEVEGEMSYGNGSWHLTKSTPVIAMVRQAGTLSSIDYVIDYTVHGSGKIFVNTTLHNRTGGNLTRNVEHTISRRSSSTGTTRTIIGNATPSLAQFVMVTCDSVSQFDLIMALKSLWNTANGAPNSASAFVGAANQEGYILSTCNINAGQRQSWDLMIDFGYLEMNDSSGVGASIAEYVASDSLEFIKGTVHMEHAWERHLRGHWKLDETTGDTVRDASGNNTHAYKTGGTWSDGNLGGALDLLAAQYITYPSSSVFDGSNHFTVSGWVKTSSFGSTATLIGKHNGTQGWKVCGNASGQVTVHCNGSQVNGVKNLESNTWRHIAVAFNDYEDTIAIYVDGVLDAIFTGGNYTVTANAANLVMGENYAGLLDDMRFYDERVSDKTLRTIYYNGFRSAEGLYELRADNDNTLHFYIDGNNAARNYPAIQIHNYWATSKPAAGCVILNGTSLTENTDYFVYLDDSYNELFIGFNKKFITSSNRLFIDDKLTGGAQIITGMPQMSWGINEIGSTDYFWVKNFSGNTFGNSTANQWYINWKMINTNSRQGDIWHFSSSVSSQNSIADTTASNLIPLNDGDHSTLGNHLYVVATNFLKTSSNTSTNPIIYAVEESSSVRIVLRIDERLVSNVGSYKIKTRWTIYPTGQIFKLDSLYQFTSAPTKFYIGAYLRYNTNSSLYKNAIKKRCGVVYSSAYPDFAYAWLSMKNAVGYQANPFDSDTLFPVSDEYRVGYDFHDNTATSAWNSASIQTVTYFDFQHSNMSNSFIDSVSNSVQFIGTGGGVALAMTTGTLLSGGSATTGDFNADGFNESEGAYVIRANENEVHFKIPARNDTCRFNPAFRITNYYAAVKPQYVYIYRGSDTVALLEGYQYNAYLNKTNRELIIQIDSLFRDSTSIFISADKTLAVKMSNFRAQGGNGCDTLFWKTESEHENLGFHLFRRIKPSYFEKIQNASSDSAKSDTLLSKVMGLYKSGGINQEDTGWVCITNDIISGVNGGTSHGPVDYRYIDNNVTNFILYEYKLESYDFKNNKECFGPIEVMPFLFAPSVFRLGANFPNPFIKMTSIRFDIPIASKVSINIYNLQGQLIKRLIKPNEVFQPSSYHIVWDGRNDAGRPMGAGPYCYRIIADKFEFARIMVMLK